MAMNYTIGQVLFVRGIFVLLIIALVAKALGRTEELKTSNYLGQLARTLLAIGATFLFVVGLSLLPLAEAIALTLGGPIFTILLANVILKERVSWRLWVAVIAGCLGVLLMRESTNSGYRWAALLLILVTLVGALRDIVSRHIGRMESRVAILWFTSAGVTIAGLCALPFGWSVITLGDVGALASSGTLLTAAHFFLIQAFRVAGLDWCLRSNTGT